ncbi:MAG TPA: sterol desaturase family protein [Candidatus Sulfotelmatobacter sp.]|nr:sterol desaturase family protein [Candidatus Sulfotelmatobacter sp.]HWI58255.1 sterol desaturase family protein [Bacillota bacterium]
MIARSIQKSQRLQARGKVYEPGAMAVTDRPLPGWLGALLVGVTFGVLLWREWRRPLRRRVEGKLRHTGRNFALASLAALALQLTESPVTRRLTALVQRRRWGLLKQLPLPAGLETLLGILLLDYTLYWWHVATHKVPFLWRFHQPHHVDLDLDATTALRFHFGELVLSVGWRAGQVVLIGISPRALSLWSTALLMEILFHHSNAALPLGLERWLNKILVTPRMHGIHHSIVREETDSNWSSGLTLWDWLHGTLRLNVPQEAIIIGVPAYRHPEAVTLSKVIAMPFGEQRPSWQLPDDGQPSREPIPVSPAQLLA